VCGGIPALVHRCFCRPNGSCCSCIMRSSSVSSGSAGFLLFDIGGLRRGPSKAPMIIQAPSKMNESRALEGERVHVVYFGQLTHDVTHISDKL